MEIACAKQKTMKFLIFVISFKIKTSLSNLEKNNNNNKMLNVDFDLKGRKKLKEDYRFKK